MGEEMGIFEVMYNCRAMRRLRPDPVPRDLLIRLIDAANQGPSGSNLQNARWIIVQDPEPKKKLAELNKTSVMSYVGPASSRTRELPHQPADKRQRMLNAVLWQAEHMHEIPALILACLEFPEPVSELEAAWRGDSIWPGVQNLLLAARALGLGATPTTLGLLDRAAVREALGLPRRVEFYCLIPVGYPMGKFGPVTRMPAESILHWDRWQESGTE